MITDRDREGGLRRHPDEVLGRVLRERGRDVLDHGPVAFGRARRHQRQDVAVDDVVTGKRDVRRQRRHARRAREFVRGGGQFGCATTAQHLVDRDDRRVDQGVERRGRRQHEIDLMGIAGKDRHPARRRNLDRGLGVAGRRWGRFADRRHRRSRGRVGGGREVLGDRRGDLDEASPSQRGHLRGHVDHAAGTQMRVERNLDHDLTAAGELLHQDRPGALVGMTVGVVEHHHGAMQQTGVAAVGQPLHRLACRRGAVDPRRGHHDQRVEIAQHLLRDRGVHRRAAVHDRDREVPVQPRRGLAVDGGVEHPSPRRAGLAREHEQARGVVADPAAHVGERVEVLVGGQLPVRTRGVRVDAAAELAERGVGVDGHHAVVLAQLGEDRADAGRDGRLTDAALAEHADLVVAAQQRADLDLQIGQPLLVGRRSEVDQPERAAVDEAPPALSRRHLLGGHQFAGADAVDIGVAGRRWRGGGCDRPVWR